MRLYFADTSFWIALLRRRDQFHGRAVEWQGSVARDGGRIVTTEAVLWERLNALADAATRSVAVEGYKRVHIDPMVDVVGFSAEVERAAVDLYRDRPGKDWSLTDCLSFVVMERAGITEALTTDHHFEQAGFKAVMRSAPGS